MLHEDDGTWYKTNNGCILHWIDELIEVLQDIKKIAGNDNFLPKKENPLSFDFPGYASEKDEEIEQFIPRELTEEEIKKATKKATWLKSLDT